jgi:hypothetical protein
MWVILANRLYRAVHTYNYTYTSILVKNSEILVGAVGIESTSYMETKEFCGAAWPSKVLKGKGGNS